MCHQDEQILHTHPLLHTIEYSNTARATAAAAATTTSNNIEILHQLYQKVTRNLWKFIDPFNRVMLER